MFYGAGDKWYVSYNYPKWKVLEFSSFEAVEEAVRGGKVDFFLARSGQLTKYIEDNRLSQRLFDGVGNIGFCRES